MSSFLILISAILHALWNALAKKNAQPQVALTGILILCSLFSFAFIPFTGPHILPSNHALLWGIGSGLFEAGYLISLAITLQNSKIGPSYVIMRGGAMLFVWLISSLFLNEPFALFTALGVGLVMLGLYLIGPQLKGYLSAYVCSFCIAGYHLCYGQSLEHGTHPALLFPLSLIISVPALCLYSGKENLKHLKKLFFNRPTPIIFTGFICALSFFIFLYGLQTSGAGQALTLRNTSVIFAQFFALMIGEKVGRNQWLGAIIVAIGASIVSVV